MFDLVFYTKYLLAPAIIGLVLHFIYIVWAKKFKYTDRPWKFGYSREALPYSSGISMAIGLLGSFGYLFYETESKEILAILISIVILLLINTIDDFGNTIEKWKIKTNMQSRLISQILVGLLIIITKFDLPLLVVPTVV